jgi:integrase
MASLRRLPGSPFWIACFTLPDGRRTQRSTKTTDRKEAQRIANKFEDASEDGKAGRLTEIQARKVVADIYALANKNTIESSSTRQFLSAWLKRKELEATEKTHLRYTTAVNHLLKFLGGKADHDIAHLSAKEISAFRDSLGERFSVGSANITLKIIRTALAQARRDGFVDTNEGQRVSLLKTSRRELKRRPFTLSEISAVLKNANEEWKGMILTGLYTGLRLSDIATMTWEHVDLRSGEITIDTAKTGRRQILPIASALARHLKALNPNKEKRGPIFPEASAARNRSQYGGTLSNQFHNILVAAALLTKRPHVTQGKGRSSRRSASEISFHSLRHTATSLLKNAGVSDVVARDIIGHDSEAVSRNYTHIDMDSKRRAIESLPDILTQ